MEYSRFGRSATPCSLYTYTTKIPVVVGENDSGVLVENEKPLCPPLLHNTDQKSTTTKL